LDYQGGEHARLGVFHLFKEFRIASYRIILSAEGRGFNLPQHKGSLFLDKKFQDILLGYSCKISSKKCSDCFLNLRCPYAAFYEKIVSNLWSSRGFGPLPAPFSWQLPLEKKTEYITGEDVFFKLNLFGDAINYLEIFIRTLQDFAAEGSRTGINKFIIKEVIAENPISGEIQLVFKDTENRIAKTDLIISGEDIEKWAKQKTLVKRLSLLFLTPTLLREDGSFLQEPLFDVIIKKLLMKISALYYFYHQRKEMDFFYQGLIDKAKEVQKVKDLSRFVSWEKEIKGQFYWGGLLGKVEYTGILQEFFPLLKLGEFLHLGENIPFGFGRYRMDI
ncbi:MAG: CRISPR system precrRNA processing endoribonuclease RAMP protein Cas6, partial [Bacillota bacterium]|nr:CRISPR system precrRNA processing endoribonuclease RAMP protein Cas6 [Bacillota bacterium]